MPQLNCNIPYIRAFVRNSYLFSNDSTELTECYIFGVKTIINRPLLFHCQLNNGAVFWSLPLSAYVLKKDFEKLSKEEDVRLSLLQWWDVQGNDVSCTAFTYLQGYRVDLRRRDKEWVSGTYLFTLDDYYADNNALHDAKVIRECYNKIYSTN